MEAFLQLLSQKRLDLAPLITHKFDISEAAAAYDIVLGKTPEPHIGILLSYPVHEQKFATLTPLKKDAAGTVRTGFIGAGSFAQSYLIPNARQWGAVLETVVTSRGITAKNVATKFSFNNASSESNDIIGNPDIDTVFIATRHDTHAAYTLASLRAGKNVFVEKPLALTPEDLEAIRARHNEHGSRLMVGFNRRFSPVAQALKQEFRDIQEPLVLNYRVNAGFIPKEHWTQQEAGGGRILGEVCHFIDLLQFFTDSLPYRVYAECIGSGNQQVKNDDNVVITLRFRNGSVGTITYAAGGDKALAKERLEIFGGNKTGIIHDFRKGELFSGNKAKLLKLEGKGHRQEVEAFLHSIREGRESPISFESIYYTTLATFKVLDSLYSGMPQVLEEEIR
jgi:polar amino acid transport system substrate-binding protein